MIRLWLLLLLALAGPSHAQTVRVTSGEHDGFTRLVFDYGRPVNWQVGRTNDGYELRLTGNPPSYDLTAAFTLIGKSRLASIWAEPQAGDLNIGLACACHVIPFEFRAGIIVLDVKDGPPPKGSSFEIPLQGDKAAPPLAAPTAPRPRKRPEAIASRAIGRAGRYDWTVVAHEALRGVTNLPSGDIDKPPALLPPDPGLQPLRDQILHQLARGASQGTVDMALPKANGTPVAITAFPSAQVRIGEPSTSVNHSDRSVSGDVGARGTPCFSPELLDVATWADTSTSVLDQMAGARNGLIGEFDRPEPAAIDRAIKFQLYLGFGAEARQMIDAFEEPGTKARIWKALSYLIDGEPDPSRVFDGQAACTGPAALWAVLGDETLQPGDAIDAGAIRLAFADLPIHLRRHLGPKLSERLLEIGSPETARALRDSILRSSGFEDASTTLMDAEANLRSGDAQKAESIANAILSDAGPKQPQALIVLTEARIAQDLPISADVALALQALLADHKGSELELKLRDALILAEAASGNFASAFQSLKTHPARQSDVWRMVGTLASDSDLLSFAVLDQQSAFPEVSDETAETIAQRLTALGLGQSAERWLAEVSAPDPMLAARTAVSRNDARAALGSLGQADGSDSQELKLQALALLGENSLQANLLEHMGNLPAASAALARAGEWERLAITGQEPWKSIAEKLAETPVSSLPDSDLPYGPLARGDDLVKAGQETRLAIDALLAAVPAP